MCLLDTISIDKRKKKNLSKNLPLSPCTPPFCDVLPKGNHDSSEGGDGGVEPLATAKSTRKAAPSLSTSNKSYPCTT